MIKFFSTKTLLEDKLEFFESDAHPDIDWSRLSVWNWKKNHPADSDSALIIKLFGQITN